MAKGGETTQTDPNSDIIRALVSQNYLNEADYKIAEESAHAQQTTVLEWLLSTGKISRRLAGQATAEFHKLPYVDFSVITIQPNLVRSLPENFAIQHRSIVVRSEKTSVLIASDQPKNIPLTEAKKTSW